MTQEPCVFTRRRDLSKETSCLSLPLWFQETVSGVTTLKIKHAQPHACSAVLSRLPSVHRKPSISSCLLETQAKVFHTLWLLFLHPDQMPRGRAGPSAVGTLRGAQVLSKSPGTLILSALHKSQIAAELPCHVSDTENSKIWEDPGHIVPKSPYYSAEL